MPKAAKDVAKPKKAKKRAEVQGKRNKKRVHLDEGGRVSDTISSTTSTDNSDGGTQSPKKKARGSDASQSPETRRDRLVVTLPKLHVDSAGAQHKPVATAEVAADAGSKAPAAAADKAAEKRARADALMGRLSAKLQSTTDVKKRLALQAKMLHLLPKCTPPQADPNRPLLANPPPAPESAAAIAGSCRTTTFALQLQKIPKAALPVLAAAGGPEEESRRRLRQQRFGAVGPEADTCKPDAILAESGGFGTSEALEKEYLRLTSLPRASDVRPPAVLALALQLVKAKWLQQPDYPAAAEQLKAIRQDLTVQHVRNALTVDVYETHGRLALEADDLAEFRRCHGVLRQLYREGLPGNPAEFEAYGLLYTQATAAARNTLSMELSRVPEHLLGHPFVRHAMEVCAAARSGNYARFMVLYDGAPRMSPYIMDKLLSQMRLWALQSTVAAYKPLPVPLSHLAEQLGLESGAEAAEFAEQHCAVVDRSAGCLDTRASASQPLGLPRPPQRQ